MELSRREKRRYALDKFKYVRTCVLARELCLLVRSARASLNKRDVRKCCSFIASLCREAGCEEASDICAEATEAVMKEEKHYLELCLQSCMLCYEGRPLPESRKAPYIT